VYCPLYQLSRDPFAAPNNGRHICAVGSFGVALLTIVRALVARKQFVAVIGASGAGKTTILNAALATLADRVYAVRVSARDCTPFALRQSTEQLLEASDQTARPVLVIEDAQHLALESLNHLAPLSTITGGGPLGLQVVLVGPVDLMETLPPSGLPRIGPEARAVIRPLSPPEADRYLAYRVKRGGGDLDQIFTGPAKASLLRAANGNPRRIDAILRSVLELGGHRRSLQVTPDLISEVIARRGVLPNPRVGTNPTGLAVKNERFFDTDGPLASETYGFPIQHRRSGLLTATSSRKAGRRAFTFIAASLLLVLGVTGVWQPWVWRDDDQAADASLAERPDAPTSQRSSAMSSAIIERLKTEELLVEEDTSGRPTMRERAQSVPRAGVRLAGMPVVPPSEPRQIPPNLTFAGNEDVAIGPERGEPANGAPNEQSIDPSQSGAADPASNPTEEETSYAPHTAEPALEPSSATPSADAQPGANPEVGDQAKWAEPAQTTSETPKSVKSDSGEATMTEPKPPLDSTASHQTQAPKPDATGPKNAIANGLPATPTESALGPVISAPPRDEAPLAPDIVAALLKRGDGMLRLGDVSGARSVYERAAFASGHAAAGAGKTYDPAFLEHIGARGNRPDPVAAAEWYRKAIALGDPEADALLRRMGEPPSSR
jgi:type II secretory pathway predicted ATPase ExeA